MLPVPEPQRTELRAVRSGAAPLADVLERLDEAAAWLARAREDADLRERSDAAAVDAFLVRAYRRAWEACLTA